MHRNGITTFFPASHPYIPHHLFPSFSVFYVLFCAGFPLSLSLFSDHSLFFLFCSSLAALNLFGFHSLSECIESEYTLMFYYCFSSNQTYIQTHSHRSNFIQRAYFSTLKHESSQFRFGLCVNIVDYGGRGNRNRKPKTLCTMRTITKK